MPVRSPGGMASSSLLPNEGDAEGPIDAGPAPGALKLPGEGKDPSPSLKL